MRFDLTILVAALACLTAGAALADGLTESPDGPEHITVYYTRDDALAEVFTGADSTWAEPWSLTAADQAAVEARLGLQLPSSEVTFFRAARAGRDLGWALELEEKGRFKPITFMVHVGSDRKVARILVMVYRESRGDEVRRARFLRQFRGKSADARLRLNRDVTAVSGATMSSRALAAGVKRALVLVDVYLDRRQAGR
jgi:hypothetical protein